MVVREQARVLQDGHLDSAGLVPAAADDLAVTPGEDRRVIEADRFIGIRQGR